MDHTGEEQLDYEDEEYGGAQKMQYQGGGTIPALADEELMGEDDEYDDLYNDVNVGESFLQLQRSEPVIPPGGVGNEGLKSQKMNANESRRPAGGLQEQNAPGNTIQGNFNNASAHFPGQKDGMMGSKGPNMGPVTYPDGSSASQKGPVPSVTHDAQVGNMGFQGSAAVSHKVGVGPVDMAGKMATESMHMPNSVAGAPRGPSQMSVDQMAMNVNVNRPVANENPIRPAIDTGATMLFVGELHWWTTDADLENALSQYGRVKEIKFFDERASGKSKGYCQVEFYDSASAAACKEGMNGHLFNGRACVVAFATPQTIKQMAASYMNKTQVQTQSQTQGRRPMNNDGGGRGGGVNYQGGDTGKNYGRGGGWGRGGPGILNRGPGNGPGRGRGGVMGAKNMVGNTPTVGGNANGAGYGQGIAGPAFGGPVGGLMHTQAMMGGFDPTYMGRGGGYGGFTGPAFPGMLPSFPAVNAMGLPGVAPHVNPAFFGRGITPNAMAMMGTGPIDGPHAGMWSDQSMGGWGGEETGRRTRESSYGGDDNASEYGYGEANHDKGTRSNAAPREKDRGSERDWSGNSERRYRDEREQDYREYKYREEKDGYRDHRERERDMGNDDDWDRGQSSSRSRSRSRAMPEEHHRSRSRDVDYGKRRRIALL
ncbi:RNA recognition motif domain [Dillenia turbinata]|uniref:RNA recognition motif domain n=1 Tax=Dillenia turbinata TaxID=194707 RepID=A0AAN8ZDI4_9MAGN